MISGFGQRQSEALAAVGEPSELTKPDPILRRERGVTRPDGNGDAGWTTHKVAGEGPNVRAKPAFAVGLSERLGIPSLLPRPADILRCFTVRFVCGVFCNKPLLEQSSSVLTPVKVNVSHVFN